MKCHVLKYKCDFFALHCVTKLLFAFIRDVIVLQIDRSQGPIDHQHFGDSLGARKADLGVRIPPVKVDIRESGVTLQSGTDSDSTIVSNVVCAQFYAFQRPVEQSSNRIE